MCCRCHRPTGAKQLRLEDAHLLGWQAGEPTGELLGAFYGGRRDRQSVGQLEGFEGELLDGVDLLEGQPVASELARPPLPAGSGQLWFLQDHDPSVRRLGLL